jgi:hypothetical protein
MNQDESEVAMEPQASAPLDPAKVGASGLIDDAKAKLGETAQTRKDSLADTIENLAGTVHRAGAQFDGQQDWVANAIGQGASELENLADTLRKKDLGEIVADIRTFAERQPALFIGVSLAAGFAIARFAKLAVADLSLEDLPTVAVGSRG